VNLRKIKKLVVLDLVEFEIVVVVEVKIGKLNLRKIKKLAVLELKEYLILVVEKWFVLLVHVLRWLLMFDL